MTIKSILITRFGEVTEISQHRKPFALLGLQPLEKFCVAM